jgi:hypothetical protein
VLNGMDFSNVFADTEFQQHKYKVKPEDFTMF